MLKGRLFLGHSTGGADTVDDLLANDVTSASSVSVPALTQVHALLANDVSSASSVSVPTLTQVHVLLANDVSSASSVTNPALAENDTVDDLLANDVSSASSVSVPALGQVHVLLANDVTSASSVSTPALDAAAEAETPIGGGTLVRYSHDHDEIRDVVKKRKKKLEEAQRKLAKLRENNANPKVIAKAEARVEDIAGGLLDYPDDVVREIFVDSNLEFLTLQSRLVGDAIAKVRAMEEQALQDEEDDLAMMLILAA